MIALPMVFMLLQTPAVMITDTIPMQWTPHRVYDSREKRFADVEIMAARAAQADVVFFGEQHDDAGTHRMQRALLEAVARRRNDVVLSMEMFERDVQPQLDAYLAGTIDEPTFLKGARPWPNYQRDYRPLLEFARARGWHVVASNVPRPMASAVAKEGLGAVTALADSTRGWAATELRCPMDGDYFKRFAEVMGGHAAPGLDATTTTRRYYEAQCVKDETMAESIVRARGSADSRPLVIHVNGSFHSDFGDGTAARVARRLGKVRTMLITGVPVRDLDAIEPKADRKRADWLVYTLVVP